MFCECTRSHVPWHLLKSILVTVVNGAANFLFTKATLVMFIFVALQNARDASINKWGLLISVNELDLNFFTLQISSCQLVHLYAKNMKKVVTGTYWLT